MRVDTAHALATATGTGLDQQRKADSFSFLLQSLDGLIVAVIAGHRRHGRGLGDSLGGDLRSHRLDGFGARTDPGDASVRAQLGEYGLLGQKAVARMYRVGAYGLGCGDNRIGVEIACRRVCRSDAYRLIGFMSVVGVGVGVGVDGDAANAEARAGARDAAGDFAPVGDQDGIEHATTSGRPARYLSWRGRGERETEADDIARLGRFIKPSSQRRAVA